jgi:hypothetical protein
MTPLPIGPAAIDPAISQSDPAGAGASRVGAAADAAVRPMHPNPSLRIDPALMMVVMEFYDASGHVAESIPSARQLNDYRRSMQAAGPDGMAPTAASAESSQGRHSGQDSTSA